MLRKYSLPHPLKEEGSGYRTYQNAALPTCFPMMSTFVVTPHKHYEIWSFEVDYIFDLVISAPPPHQTNKQTKKTVID